MCLPFCCGNDDHGSPSQGGTTGMTTTHDPQHGDSKSEPDAWSSTGNGKESNNGNGASENKKREDFKNGGQPPPPPSPPLPPTPPPQSPEIWSEHYSSTSSWQASEHIDKHKSPSPTPATKGPKMMESPEHRGQISTVPTPASKGPKQPEHLASGPDHQGPVSARAPQREDKATDTMRTPPSPQIARRGGEGDYYPTAPVVPVSEQAADNGLGDSGHDDDDDDIWTPVKSKR